MAQSQRDFDIAAFRVRDLPESEVIAYINANAVLFRSVRLSQVTVTSSEREAKQILAQVKSEALSFEDAAKAQSQDSYADRGGDTGLRSAFEFVEIIPDEKDRESVLSLGLNEISSLVKTRDGWAFFRCEEALNEAELTDIATIEKARNYIFDNERAVAEDYFFAEAEKFRVDAAERGFDAACYSAGITKSSVGPLAVNYGDTDLFPSVTSFDVQVLSGAATNENFWRSAFSTKVGEVSAPVVLGENVVLLYPKEEISIDDENRQSIIDYFTQWASNAIESGLRRTLLDPDGKKFEDNFDETYDKIFAAAGG
jgi:hypothetical protein